MNREQLEDLTDDELNNEVLKRFGWVLHSTSKSGYEHYRPPHLSSDEMFWYIPDYVHNLNKTMELLDHITKIGKYWCSIYLWSDEIDRAVYITPNGKDNDWGFCVSKGIDKNLGRAICLAYLLMKQEEE